MRVARSCSPPDEAELESLEIAQSAMMNRVEREEVLAG
jgi:hypothetical protein